MVVAEKNQAPPYTNMNFEKINGAIQKEAATWAKTASQPSQWVHGTHWQKSKGWSEEVVKDRS